MLLVLFGRDWAAGRRTAPRREGTAGIYGAESVAGPPCCGMSGCVRRHWYQNLSWQDEQQQDRGGAKEQLYTTTGPEAARGLKVLSSGLRNVSEGEIKEGFAEMLKPELWGLQYI